MEIRILDQYAHRRMNVKVLGAARLVKTNADLIYVRRSESDYSGMFPGYIFTLFKREAGNATWDQISVGRTLAAFIANSPLDHRGRVANREYEIVGSRSLVPYGSTLISTEPPAGWLWRRGSLSEKEQANLVRNGLV